VGLVVRRLSVDLSRRHAALAQLPEINRAREVSFADATRLIAARLHRTADEPEAEGEGDPRAQHDQERRRRDDLELGRPHEVTLGGQRLRDLERPAPDPVDRHRDVGDTALVARGQPPAHHGLAPGKDRRQLLAWHLGRIGRHRVGLERHPAQREVGVALVGVGDEPARRLLPVRAPYHLAPLTTTYATYLSYL